MGILSNEKELKEFINNYVAFINDLKKFGNYRYLSDDSKELLKALENSFDKLKNPTPNA